MDNLIHCPECDKVTLTRKLSGIHNTYTCAGCGTTFEDLIDNTEVRVQGVDETGKPINGLHSRFIIKAVPVDVDEVNNPKHYADGHKITLECIMFKRWLHGDLSDAFKYIWRAGNKDDITKDIRKAIWYLRDAIEYNITCDLGLLVPFLPVNTLPTWKYTALVNILRGNNEGACSIICAQLEKIKQSDASDGSRLIDSPSADERA